MIDQRDITDLTVPVAEVTHSLPDLQKALADNPDGTVFITDQGKPTMVLLSWEGWQAMAGLLETLEVMTNPETAAVIRQVQPQDDTDAIPWKKVRQQLIDDGRCAPSEI